MGENWAAFCPSLRAECRQNLQEKNGQHFVLLLYKTLPPKNYNRFSPNYGTLWQAIPQFLGHYGTSTLECH